MALCVLNESQTGKLEALQRQRSAGSPSLTQHLSNRNATQTLWTGEGGRQTLHLLHEKWD